MGYQWNYVPYDVTHFILALLYVFLVLLCLRGLISRWDSQGRWCSLCPSSLFYYCMIVGSIGRVVFFTFAPFIREGWQFPVTLNMLLNSYPSFLYFSGFSILVTMWAERSPDAAGSSVSISTFRVPLVVSNVLMWSIVLGLYIAMFVQTGVTSSEALAVPETALMMAVFVFCAAIDLLILVGCVLYGALVWRQLRSVYSMRKVAVLKRMAVMTLIIATIFTIRAALTIWAMFWAATYTKLFFFDLLYFTLMELIPLCIMLIMLRGIDFGRASDYTNRRAPLVSDAEAAAILVR